MEVYNTQGLENLDLQMNLMPLSCVQMHFLNIYANYSMGNGHFLINLHLKVHNLLAQEPSFDLITEI